MKLGSWLVIAVGFGIAGCSESVGPREVPVNTAPQATPSTAPSAATQAPRAIATH